MNAPHADKKYNAQQLATMMADIKVPGGRPDYIKFLAELIQACYTLGQNAIIDAAIVMPLQEYTDAERQKVQTFTLDERTLKKMFINPETLPAKKK